MDMRQKLPPWWIFLGWAFAIVFIVLSINDLITSVPQPVHSGDKFYLKCACYNNVDGKMSTSYLQPFLLSNTEVSNILVAATDSQKPDVLWTITFIDSDIFRIFMTDDSGVNYFLAHAPAVSTDNAVMLVQDGAEQFNLNLQSKSTLQFNAPTTIQTTSVAGGTTHNVEIDGITYSPGIFLTGCLDELNTEVDLNVPTNTFFTNQGSYWFLSKT